MKLPSCSQMLPPLDDSSIPGTTTICVADFAHYIRERKPLLYLRFSDGELISMFRTGRRRINADGHQYYFDTMGPELCDILERAVEDEEPSIRIELALCWQEWEAMRQWIPSLTKEQLAKIVVGTPWPAAIKDQSVFQFLEACRASTLTKVLISKPTDKPVAEAIGARFIDAPKPDVYEVLDQIIERLQEAIKSGPAVIISCIGMATECLLWRTRDSRNIAIDAGHLCDALLGVGSRRYLRRSAGAQAVHKRFLEWAKEKA